MTARKVMDDHHSFTVRVKSADYTEPYMIGPKPTYEIVLESRRSFRSDGEARAVAYSAIHKINEALEGANL